VLGLPEDIFLAFHEIQGIEHMYKFPGTKKEEERNE
jgi:hypothetical protein